MTARGRLAIVLLAAAAVVALAPAAAAEEADFFRAGYEALAVGKYEDAIAALEAHADRAPPHPEASFNRGLAYLVRVRAGAERGGDLGRAAAAFEEALRMRPDDEEAAHALELIRAEVARRRARSGKDVVTATPSLDRVLVSLASARAWGISAIVASFCLALGLGLRWRRHGPVHLAGVLLAPIAAVALGAFVPLAVAATRLEQSVRPGVLVVREAFLADEHGVALGGDPVTEAARLEVGERRGAMVEVRYGTRAGWLPAGAVQVLRLR